MVSPCNLHELENSHPCNSLNDEVLCVMILNMVRNLSVQFLDHLKLVIMQPYLCISTVKYPVIISLT